MAIHDAYARRTPYELLLPDEAFAEERFRAIGQEAEERGTDPRDPERFVMLMAVGETLRELRGPDEDPARIRQHGALLFHAYHFREAGEPLWLLSTTAARYAVEAAGTGDAGDLTGSGPPAAGYLQLPQHLFWVRKNEAVDGKDGASEAGDGSPESLDGLFWTRSGDHLVVLAASGLRKDRPGFSVLSLPPAPLADAESWMGESMRGAGDDFDSTIPGSELETLYEIRTPGEVLKLLARAFWLTSFGAVVPVEPAKAAGDAAGPIPSELPYRRIELGEP